MSPYLEAAYESLCRSGQLGTEAQLHRLGDLTFRHPNKGVCPIMVDDSTLRLSSDVYARTPFRNALRQLTISAKPYQAIATRLEDIFKQDHLIWGVSGFASVEYDYTDEGRGLSELYSYLGGEQQPGLIVDGGVAQGVLGLSGVLAALHGLPTLGCIPLQGLAAVGQRDEMLVWGNTYRDREILVGTLPDILVCVGGGPGTIRECLHALDHNSVVLLLSLKPYDDGTLPHISRTNEKMRAAAREGRLLVCDSVSTVAQKAQWAWKAGLKHRLASRAKRLPDIKMLLNVAA